MRKMLVAHLMVAVCGAVALFATQVYAAPCTVPAFMQHQSSSFTCRDKTEVAALAWQRDNAANHSGTEDIACEANGVDRCISGGTLDDGIVTIDFNWANPLISGCPIIAGVPQRVMVWVQCNDGMGILASVGGASVDATGGYIVDLAHKFAGSGDPSTPDPVVAGNGRPTVNSATNNADGTATLDLTFPQLPILSDCDPDSVGTAFGLCTDQIRPAAARGRVFTRIQTCGTFPNIDRALWTLNTVTPDATGKAVVTAQRPTSPNDCLFVGASSIIDGTESGGITGFVPVGGPGAPSPVALDVRAEQAGANVKIRWRTDLELGLAGFNILTESKNKGLVKLNEAMIPATGAGGGKSYTESVARSKFQSGRTVIIESVLTDGTTLKSAPAKF